MPMSPPAVTTSECDFSLLGSGDFLARHPIFQARDLESVRHYLSGVLAPHRLTYWTRERGIDFRHQIAKIGAVDLNTIRFGGDVMVAAPDVPDFYLLHFMLAGNGTLTQGGRSFDQPAGSVTVINSNRSFAKKVSSASRQLLIRIERSLLERELQAWIGREPKQLIEFDQSQAFAITKVATLTHAVRMLCDDLGDDSSSLDHPLVRDRVASALVAALLVGLPHNHSRAFEGAQSPISPASVRRAEQFIEEHATKAIGLADIACAAGVSARALQMAFRRFRDTTPMAHLRALRLDMARNELIRARRDGGSVASVATAHGFGSLSRFAADYKARFHEQPSETLRYSGC